MKIIEGEKEIQGIQFTRRSVYTDTIVDTIPLLCKSQMSWAILVTGGEL